MRIRIYHNPACSNSRAALALIRSRGIEPEIVAYLDTPPDRDTLVGLLAALGLSPRELLRSGQPEFANLGLEDPGLSDDRLIDAMLTHPILIQRPIVVAAAGARICRPPERVLALLPETGMPADPP